MFTPHTQEVMGGGGWVWHLSELHIEFKVLGFNSEILSHNRKQPKEAPFLSQKLVFATTFSKIWASTLKQFLLYLKTSKPFHFLNIFFERIQTLHSFMRVHINMDRHTSLHACGSQRTTFSSCFSSYHVGSSGCNSDHQGWQCLFPLSQSFLI